MRKDLTIAIQSLLYMADYAVRSGFRGGEMETRLLWEKYLY